MEPTPSSSLSDAPGIQLLKLGLLVGLGMIVTLIASFLVIVFSNGFEVFTNPAMLANIRFDGNVLKFLLVVQQILIFLLPALLFARVQGWRTKAFYGFDQPKIQTLILLVLLMCCSMPILGLVTEWNTQMQFPPFLKDVETWMREQENDAAKTTELILKMDNIWTFLINLLVIAVTPAVCEELIFRGALQGVFVRLVRNPHLAIWISAIIFSAIHIQFFGFFPRLLLGVAFGYIYLWTKNLWYTIFAHFLNNGYVVVIMYYLQKNNLPIKEADEISIAWYGYVISAILTLALFKIIKERSVRQSKIV